jgi:hypothetical protein
VTNTAAADRERRLRRKKVMAVGSGPTLHPPAGLTSDIAAPRPF